ncbi:hypothetical protein [Paenibacillus pabuli]|nr:hypothetical protein [Paenibacillus pabuli]
MMHAEFKMLDQDGAIVSLTPANVDYIKQDGVTITPEDDGSIWFSAASPAGQYTFEAKMKSGDTYVAVLDWEPDPTP